MKAPWVVEFYATVTGRHVLFDEVRELLTVRQIARLRKHVGRLETYGPGLDGDFFDRVRGSALSLGEFRVTLDKVELRLLFSLEPGRTYVMLVAHKEKRGDIPRSKIQTAEQRLRDWRSRHREV